MATQSRIEWTESTWNPLTGCTKISPGCKHCYAETFAERFRGVKGHPYEQGFDLRLVPEKLTEPLNWPTPKMVFVNSMSDLFQSGISDDYVELVSRVMMIAKWHTYQVLTKRSERLLELLNCKLQLAADAVHIWWGVSVEDRKYGLPRIRHLQDSPARIRFLSIEPLLEDLGKIDLSGVSWVIVGGESGPGARPMRKEWVTSIRDQCREQGSTVVRTMNTQRALRPRSATEMSVSRWRKHLSMRYAWFSWHPALPAQIKKGRVLPPASFPQ